ncbi:MAG TPA: O-antigen ligase family protein [Solirubrobacteraceae bacterium]|nr:O-antigen ligase family protein [Solirubrobacteraceae bacterium]
MDAAVPLATVLGSGGEKVGIVAVALLAAAAVLATSRRRRAQVMAATLVLAPLLLLAEVWDTSQVHFLRNHPATALVAVACALAAVAALAALLHRHPRLLPPLALAALPFRLPIAAGGRPVNLLIPLYLVVAAGALAWALPVLRERERMDLDPHADVAVKRAGPRPRARPRGLEYALLAFIVLYGAQAAYSSDARTALQQMVFFYVPFALLFSLLREVDFDAALARRCLIVLVGLAFVFVGIGFVEYATRHLLLNPRVIRTNESSTYFRVNSIFFDPNIYGRFLVVVMLGLAAAVLWARNRRDRLLGVLALAVLWAGLVLTLSQSSFVALLLGLALLAALRWSVRRTLLVVGVVAALGAGAAIAFPGKLCPHRRSLSACTSGRTDVSTGGLRLVRDRPLYGFGSGSFREQYKARLDPSQRRGLTASHNTAITIGAEQGAIGLVAYLLLLFLAFRMLATGFAGAGEESIGAARAAVAAAFAGLVLHTMFYADFLEDPMTWALLGIGFAMAPPPRTASIAQRVARRQARRARASGAAAS